MRFGATALISGVTSGGGGIENGHGLKSPYEVSSRVASAKVCVWRSMSAPVVAGDIRAMLWKGVRRTPWFRA